VVAGEINQQAQIVPLSQFEQEPFYYRMMLRGAINRANVLYQTPKFIKD
jgi:hypothetical protein